MSSVSKKTLPRVHVAVGVIENKDGKIFIAKRPDDKHMGGYWEFPGGKVEAGESLSSALGRELKEELAIEVEAHHELINIPFDYPTKTVILDVHVVDKYQGQPQGAEGQEVRWVSPSELVDVRFPEANKPIVQALLKRLN